MEVIKKFVVSFVVGAAVIIALSFVSSYYMCFVSSSFLSNRRMSKSNRRE